ncbi:hypothetical protein [Mucilaginibacter antarcticus]|uniref:Secreted Zn-dependent protease n=1 Tax=Mucilaginibacter antarcticus TaxID=1855725 RepID=A0ABW5XRK2_9SPHI
MLTRLFLISLVWCLVSLTSSGQIITWSKTRKLQWTDFKGAVTDSTAAASVVGIRFMPVEYHTAVKKGRYKASAVFDTKLSFRVPNRATNYLLRHERLHFDIAAIFAVRLQKRADKKGLISEREAKIMFTEINNALMVYQEKYDDETAHGTGIVAQAGWQKISLDQIP